MKLLLPRLSRILIAFAIAGWVAGFLVVGSDEGHTFSQSLVSRESLQAALVGGVLGAILSPALLKLRVYGGALAGLAAVPLAMTLYFTLWPPEWAMPTWKMTGLMLKSYWYYLLPVGAAAGGIGAWWAGRLADAPEQEPEE